MRSCGRWTKAQVPAEHATGYGPRFSALMGEVGRDLWQRPPHGANLLCLGAAASRSAWAPSRKCSTGVTQAIDPYYAVIAQQARQAPVNYIDETPWYCDNTLAVALGDGQ